MGKAWFDDEYKRRRAKVKKQLLKFLRAKIRAASARVELVEETKELKELKEYKQKKNWVEEK